MLPQAVSEELPCAGAHEKNSEESTAGTTVWSEDEVQQETEKLLGKKREPAVLVLGTDEDEPPLPSSVAQYTEGVAVIAVKGNHKQAKFKGE